MPSKDFILWLDLECTGSGDAEEIMEIGLVMTRSTGVLEEVGRKKIVLPVWGSDVEQMEDVVVQMHTKNGLLKESIALGAATPATDRQRILREIDLYLAGWVKGYSRNNHVPLAGSGVSHYDRKYIKRDLPFFNSTLTYWAYDIGTVRRSLALAGVEIKTYFGVGKTHRADEDAAFHAQEMRDFIAWASHRGVLRSG